MMASGEKTNEPDFSLSKAGGESFPLLLSRSLQTTDGDAKRARRKREAFHGGQVVAARGDLKT